MSKHSEAFVVFDSSKLRNAVAIADGGREGEVRFLGEIDSNMAAITQLVRKLEANYERITFCYEAGPTGYELQRHIKALGHECLVVAPSLIPKKPGDRVKTNRRDAMSLVKLLRAGELTAVWVPDRRHEAMRDLTRARETAVIDLRAKRQQVSAFLLRQGRWYPAGKKTWTKVHMEWLAQQKFEQPERRMVFEEMIFAIRQAQERVARLEQAIRAAVPDWSLAKMVTAFMALRGIDLVSAADLAISRAFQPHRKSWDMSAWAARRARPAIQSSVARSPNRVIGERAARWWSAPGATNIRHGLVLPNSRRSRQRRQRCARSPGRHSPISIAATER